MLKSIVLSGLLLCVSFVGFAQNETYSKWVVKGDSLYNAKDYKQSAVAYTNAFAANDGKAFPDDRYNAACVWSLAGNSDSAFYNLNRLANKAAFANINHLISDPDLNNLHTDSRWIPLCDLVKQNKEKAESGLNKPLVAILDTVMQNDQKYRMQIESVETKYGQQSNEMKELWKIINYYDSTDLLKVTDILDKYGWVGPDVVGGEGNEAIFLVIQHSDLKVQDKYLPMMREAVKNHKAQPASLALLEDRVALGHGGKQVYGSQITNDGSGNFLAPMIDPDNVDKRRAEVGLGPIAEYLQYFHMTWNLEEYKQQLQELEKRQHNFGN